MTKRNIYQIQQNKQFYFKNATDVNFTGKWLAKVDENKENLPQEILAIACFVTDEVDIIPSCI